MTFLYDLSPEGSGTTLAPMGASGGLILRTDSGRVGAVPAFAFRTYDDWTCGDRVVLLAHGKLGIATASPKDRLEAVDAPAAGAVAGTVTSSTGPVAGSTTHNPGTGTKVAWRASDNGNAPQEVGYIAVVADAADSPGAGNWRKDMVFAVCEGGAGLPLRERLRIAYDGTVWCAAQKVLDPRGCLYA